LGLRPISLFVYAATLQLAGIVAASAGPAADAVKSFYDNPDLDIDQVSRDRFVDPAKTVLDGNDTVKKSGQGDCLDPHMALDNVLPGRAELEKSLKTAEAVNGDEAKVIVAFTASGEPHRLEWKLKKIGGAWKIEDLLSVTGEWALSQYHCE
jgi:hypothetical protein